MLSEANMNNILERSDACEQCYGFRLSTQNGLGGERIYNLTAAIEKGKESKIHKNVRWCSKNFGRHCRHKKEQAPNFERRAMEV